MRLLTASAGTHRADSSAGFVIACQGGFKPGMMTMRERVSNLLIGYWKPYCLFLTFE